MCLRRGGLLRAGMPALNQWKWRETDRRNMHNPDLENWPHWQRISHVKIHKISKMEE